MVHTAPLRQKTVEEHLPAPFRPDERLLLRVLTVVLASMFGVVVALVAGFLVWMDGASVAGAILTGSGAGGGALALALAVAGVLRRGL